VKGRIRRNLDHISKTEVGSIVTHRFADPISRFGAVNGIQEVEVHISANSYAGFWYNNGAYRHIYKSPTGS
jgi:hypothetical protein